MSEGERVEMCEIAHSSIILHLADNVLRRVGKIEKVDELWEKLEELYMPKSLSSQIYLKETVLRVQNGSSKELRRKP